MTELRWMRYNAERAVVSARRGRAADARRFMAEAEAEARKFIREGEAATRALRLEQPAVIAGRALFRSTRYSSQTSTAGDRVQ